MKYIKNILTVMIGVFLGLVIVEMRYGVFENLFMSEMTETEKVQYIEDLRTAMMERETEIQLEYHGAGDAMEKFVSDSVEQAFLLDKEDTSSDGDYMRYVHSASRINMNGFGKKYTIQYTMKYLETKEQTRQVEAEVENILKKLKISEKSDYGKIKAIHDYIVKNVTYDLSTDFNSPYYALVKGSSACQGYATLFYKMATDAGIPCCVVTGTAQGGLHAWNMVELEDKWYYIDTTWDDPVGVFGESTMNYNFFLKSESEMKDHVLDEAFHTDEFESLHPAAENGYRKK